MRIGRFIGVSLGTIAILVVGAYAPVMLVGPLPDPTVSVDAVPSLTVTGPALPATGASAVAAGSELLGAAGDTEALPIDGATRLITALVVAERFPLAADAAGPAVPIGEADYQDFRARLEAGERTIAVYPGDTWSQREVLQAALLSDSGNHATTLALWAYGSNENYLSAARTWAQKNHLDSLVLVDAAGTTAGNLASAADLARIAALVQADPGLHAVLTSAPSGIAAQREVASPDTYLAERGLGVLYRGYNARAGIILVFTARVPAGEESFEFAGASLRSDTWGSLESEMNALLASAEAGVRSGPLLETGTPLITLTAAWGERVQGISGEMPTTVYWPVRAPEISVSAREAQADVQKGDIVGTIRVAEDKTALDVPILATGSLDSPDIPWRLLHPLPLIGAWIDSFAAPAL